jgi:hypothetical protein
MASTPRRGLNTSELQPVRHAVAQIGTNALPFLISSLNHRESGWHRTVRQLTDIQSIVAIRLTDPRIRLIRAIRALAILGSAARPAIPSLKAQLADPSVAQHAVYALSGMGPDGMQVLVNEFNSLGSGTRRLIAMALVSPTSIYRGEDRAETNQVPPDILVEGLGRVVRDSTSSLRRDAIFRLGTLGAAASNAVPALLSTLSEQDPMTRQMTIMALGQIKARPDLVIPALTNLLSQLDFGGQIASLSTLRIFGCDFGRDLQFQPHLPDFEWHRRKYVPGGTNQFGPSGH